MIPNEVLQRIAAHYFYRHLIYRTEKITSPSLY